MTTTSSYRFGGRSAILSAASTLAASLLVLLIGVPPTDAEDLLRYLSPMTAPWSAIASLSVLADLLVLPFAYALYRALRDVGGNLARAGCGLLVVFAILDMAVRWPKYAALITLAEQWSDATTTELGTLIVAAGHATAVLRSFLLPIYVTLIPGIGVLLVSVVWHRAELGRLVAYVGMAVGVLAVAVILAAMFVSSLGVLMIVSTAAAAVWVGLAGYALLRLEPA